jgi:hypothetical protein
MLNINLGAGARARVASHCSSTTMIKAPWGFGSKFPATPAAAPPALAITAPFPTATVMVLVALAPADLSGYDSSLSEGSGGSNDSYLVPCGYGSAKLISILIDKMFSKCNF